MFYLTVTFLLLGQVLAQDQNCDFRQSVSPSQTYYIYSPNYDASYPRGVQCRWIANCPAGYNCRVDCYLNMPLTQGCTSDRLLISRFGDGQLMNAERYCGRQTLTAVSINQTLSIGLIVDRSSPGGNFYCNLTAQASAPPPQQQCTCGVRKQPRIVGGTNTGVNEYTMAAALIDRSIESILCGAVIVNNNYVMSAAHCFDNQIPSNILVHVGHRDYTQGTKIQVARLIPHPQYNSNSLDNDIGLVFLARPLIFNDNLTPVCMPFKFQNRNIDSLAGSYLTLLGWGTQSFGGPISEILKKVDVQVITQQQCARTETITSRQICTNSTGRDACQNDSGGPGLYTDPRTGLLISIGVISQGVNCAERPGVGTRVTPYLDWIVMNAPGQYCVVP